MRAAPILWRDIQHRVGTDAYADLARAQVLLFISFDVKPDLVFYGREVTEPGLELLGHPDARQILIAWPESEPAAHLEQSVVGLRGRTKKLTTSPSSVKPAREGVAADCDRDHGFARVVQPIAAAEVVQDHTGASNDRAQPRQQFVERHMSQVEPGCSDSMSLGLPLRPKLVEKIRVVRSRPAASSSRSPSSGDLYDS